MEFANGGTREQILVDYLTCEYLDREEYHVMGRNMHYEIGPINSKADFVFVDVESPKVKIMDVMISGEQNGAPETALHLEPQLKKLDKSINPWSYELEKIERPFPGYDVDPLGGQVFQQRPFSEEEEELLDEFSRQILGYGWGEWEELYSPIDPADCEHI